MRWKWGTLAVCAALALVAGCDGCRKKREKDAPAPKRSDPSECASAADCVNENPCIEGRCSGGRCVDDFVPAGTVCDEKTACDAVSKCDGKGRCKAGPPPVIDDGNPCTVDACDPAKGPTHTAVDVDDQNVCTNDSCNPTTGEIVHDPVSIDDGDDCTFDSCDPVRGPKHDRPNPTYTCDASCGSGYHAASRSANAECAAKRALQTFCVPDCGASFYACDTRCPAEYHASSARPSAQCGSGSPTLVFCEKNAGESFYTCDASCPEGYREEPGGSGAQCGTLATTRLRCVK